MGVEQNKMDELFKWDGKPDVAPTISLALQHLVAMIIGCVTPAIIISKVAGLEIGQRIILIQASLTMYAICTFFQLFPLKKGVFGSDEIKVMIDYLSIEAHLFIFLRKKQSNKLRIK